ncbi:hypothetical protein [Cohnella sp. WQ 127256]|uniref:hypothetical protein n=1 Tax=Cohnella sp. WQ 127256 TaxID=2938790 RepID=UPI002118E7E0|nr:hypothetical protein [Cohnella sp. WQ 127256]
MELINEDTRQFFPVYIYEYILRSYIDNKEEFDYQYKKAMSNSKRNGIKDPKYNLWIAANLTDVKIRSKLNPQVFSCYYCLCSLIELPQNKVIFEHFIPKLHIPANIVSSCDACDKFKKDRQPEEFVRIIEDDKLIEIDKYVKTRMAKEKLLHFAPLVACRVGNPQLWKQKMIEIAEKYYKADLTIINKGQIRYHYASLYRKRWN